VAARQREARGTLHRSPVRRSRGSCVEVGDESYRLDLTDRENGDRVHSSEDGVRLTVGEDEAYLRVPGGQDFQDCETS
jgi:hypothetical protein